MLLDPATVRLRAYQLMEAAQEQDRATAAADLVELEHEAGLRGWLEEAFVAAAGHALSQVLDGADGADAAVAALVRRGERLMAPELLALALSLRALTAARRGDGEQLLSDAGRAVVLQDDPARPALDRCMVLAICAGAYNTLRLWELVDELYDAASALAPHCEVPVLEPAVSVSRVMVRLEWAAALLEVGDEAGAVVQLVRTGEAAEAAERVPRMPTLWRLTARACRDVAAFARQTLAWRTDSDVSWLPERLERLDEQRVRLREEGDVELLPLFDAMVSLGLLSCGHREDAVRRLGEVEFASSSSGAVSFPLWVRAQVLTPAAADEGAHAHREYGALVGRLRWTARQGLLDAARARITAERLAAENAALARDVRLDPLTGLANRRVFDAWLTDPHSDEPAVALVLVDLDHFKVVNDEHGHAVGDEVLRRVGRLLAGHVRPGDLALRLGGDEFAVVLRAGPSEEQLDALEAVAATRAAEVVAAITATDWERLVPDLWVRISVGFAVAQLGPADPSGADRLYRAADSNLYEAKAHRARRGPLTA